MSAIITRQKRRRKFRVRGLALPIFAIGALAAALVWPPSHRIIVDGPLKPVWPIAGKGLQYALIPIHWAYQQQAITDKNREIRLLSSQLEDERQQLASKDQELQATQGQVRAAEAAQAGSAETAAAAPSDAELARTAAVWSSMATDNVAKLIATLPTDYVAKVFAKMSTGQVADILNSLAPADAAKYSQALGSVSSTGPTLAASNGGPSPAEIARTASYWGSMDPENAAKVAAKLPVAYVSKVFAKMPADSVADILNAMSPSDAAKYANTGTPAQ